ncbi:MAG: bifunctional (p)ppGpp synthetase/guanosine-3',5'-bis(diphosphate) 3'-pyrophosphohydrolase [candidate division KSB1 bacterium]|nr:bifunctional (p)ppGpp synthetase/guanosine-3',5'-bis(diphosphate) 3'-pyrophosphohydrolase [candidate division KSB1 bacterium]
MQTQTTTTSEPTLAQSYGETVEGLLLRMARYQNSADIELVRRAFELSYEAHKGQRRNSGEPYFEHPLEVAKILVGLKMDYQTVIGGILHDTVEDTYVTLDMIRKEFGEQVARLVDGVTKISNLKLTGFQRQQAENFKKMLMSMVHDIRVILIKFADRLHNMRTLEYLAEEKRRRIALETQQVYAPLAHRLGLSRIKAELEDLAFKHLEPETYQDLVRRVAETKEEREQAILIITNSIRNELVKNHIPARLEGRAKHYASIWHKMTVRGVPFEEITDLQAIRIIVDKVSDCYAALGIVHSLHKTINERFKDYIANPKANGYQSIHTTIIGPLGKKYEVQIRTEDMHRVAEEGIAAHWRYKEGKLHEDELDRQLTWLRQFLESEEEQDDESFLEHLKINLFPDEIFVYTPKGDLYRLPVNSTPVDFAFAVHTDIGMHCFAARVNNRIQPLSYKLKSGDVVAIITSPNKYPNKDWLQFVVTSKARSKIKKYLRDVEFESSVNLGQEILAGGVNRIGLKYKNINLSDLAEKLHYNSEKQLLAALGRGNLKLETVLRRLVPDAQKLQPQKAKFPQWLVRQRKSESTIRVAGMDNILVNFARCCNPVPGEPITGVITKGRGIVVHSNACKNLEQLIQNPDRIMDVSWNISSESKRFVAGLQVLGERRKNTLADISANVEKSDSVIVSMKMGTDNSLFTCRLEVEVYNLDHLNKLIANLKKVEGVVAIERFNALVS